jgi:hypothetical protein
MFLVYGGDEVLVVKGYVDASFDIDRMILNLSQGRFIF